MKLRFLMSCPRKNSVGDKVIAKSEAMSHATGPMDCSTPGLPVHHQLPELTQHMSVESVMPSNHLILCYPLLLPPSIFPSIRVFSNESVLHIRWPKYYNFSFSINPSNEHLAWFPSGWTGWVSLQSKGLSRVFSNTTVQKHQFFSAQLSLPSNFLYSPMSQVLQCKTHQSTREVGWKLDFWEMEQNKLTQGLNLHLLCLTCTGRWVLYH